MHDPRPRASEAHRLDGLRVLLVDDSSSKRLWACSLLAGLGIEPTVASGGAQAVRLVQAMAFDVILMDLLMPDVDGWSATAQIRQHEATRGSKRPIPVIAFTTSLAAAAAPRTLVCGFNEVLRKPCEADALAACLTRWCPVGLDA
jgi:CheY-like chemotaxis protein